LSLGFVQPIQHLTYKFSHCKRLIVQLTQFILFEFSCPKSLVIHPKQPSSSRFVCLKPLILQVRAVTKATKHNILFQIYATPTCNHTTILDQYQEF